MASGRVVTGWPVCVLPPPPPVRRRAPLASPRWSRTRIRSATPVVARRSGEAYVPRQARHSPKARTVQAPARAARPSAAEMRQGSVPTRAACAASTASRTTEPATAARRCGDTTVRQACRTWASRGGTTGGTTGAWGRTTGYARGLEGVSWERGMRSEERCGLRRCVGSHVVRWRPPLSAGGRHFEPTALRLPSCTTVTAPATVDASWRPATCADSHCLVLEP